MRRHWQQQLLRFYFLREPCVPARVVARTERTHPCIPFSTRISPTHALTPPSLPTIRIYTLPWFHYAFDDIGVRFWCILCTCLHPSRGKTLDENSPSPLKHDIVGLYNKHNTSSYVDVAVKNERNIRIEYTQVYVMTQRAVCGTSPCDTSSNRLTACIWPNSALKSYNVFRNHMPSTIVYRKEI